MNAFVPFAIAWVCLVVAVLLILVWDMISADETEDRCK